MELVKLLFLIFFVILVISVILYICFYFPISKSDSSIDNDEKLGLIKVFNRR